MACTLAWPLGKFLSSSRHKYTLCFITILGIFSVLFPSGFILRGAGSPSCSAPPRPRGREADRTPRPQGREATGTPRPRKVAKRPGPHPLGREASGTLLKVAKRETPQPTNNSPQPN